MHKATCALILGLLTVLLIGSSRSAAEWGSLKGRFVVDGTPAKLAPLRVDKDAYCIQKNPPNEAVVIGKGDTLVNAIVYLRVPPGKKIDVAPEYEAKFKQPVVLDNNGCQFKPHIVTVRVGQQLTINNSDPVSHNTNLSLFAFNPILPANQKNQVQVSTESALPSNVNCNIHTWMKGYLVSLSHPYVAVSGNDGTFEIKNMPAGTNEFQFWHEAPGYLKNLKFKGGATDSLHGRAKLTIEAGKTLDLGDIKVPARVLVSK